MATQFVGSNSRRQRSSAKHEFVALRATDLAFNQAEKDLVKSEETYQRRELDCFRLADDLVSLDEQYNELVDEFNKPGTTEAQKSKIQKKLDAIEDRANQLLGIKTALHRKTDKASEDLDQAEYSMETQRAKASYKLSASDLRKLRILRNRRKYAIKEERAAISAEIDKILLKAESLS